MLPIKLVRSLVLGETINNPFLLNQNHHNHETQDEDHDDFDDNGVPDLTYRRRRKCKTSKSSTNSKTPLLFFLPNKEIVKDTYRLATIARDIGLDLHPTPSLSHIIFSRSSSSTPSSSSSSPSSSLPSSFSSSSSSWSLTGDAIPLPFPSLASASDAHLRCFVRLSRGLFKLVFYNSCVNSNTSINNKSNGVNTSNWDCCSLTLVSRLTGEHIKNMDSFSRVLAGVGWTLFKTMNNPSLVSGGCRYGGVNAVYLFKKIDSNRIRVPQLNLGGPTGGEFRIRELRLPPLDFKNAPLRILQYILLMTDDLFYLA